MSGASLLRHGSRGRCRRQCRLAGVLHLLPVGQRAAGVAQQAVGGGQAVQFAGKPALAEASAPASVQRK